MPVFFRIPSASTEKASTTRQPMIPVPLHHKIRGDYSEEMPKNILHAKELIFSTLMRQTDWEYLIRFHHISDVLKCLSILYAAQPSLLNEENCIRLATVANNADEIKSGLNMMRLTDSSLITQRHLELLIEHASEASSLGGILSSLYDSKYPMDKKDYDLLARHADEADRIDCALDKIKREPALVKKSNFRLLVKHPQYAVNLANIFSKIYPHVTITNNIRRHLVQNLEKSEKILTALERFFYLKAINEKNVLLVIKNADNAHSISSAINSLRKKPGFQQLVEGVCGDFINKHAAIADSIVDILYLLYCSNPALVTAANYQLIVKSGENTQNIFSALILLSNVSPRLVTQTHFTLLATHKEQEMSFARAICDLYRESPCLVNKTTRSILTLDINNIDAMVDIISVLYKYNPTMVTIENAQLFHQSSDSYKIRSALSMLMEVEDDKKNRHASKGTSPDSPTQCLLTTPENYMLIVKNESNAMSIARVLGLVYQHIPSLLTAKTRELLASHADDSKYIIEGLIDIYDTNPKLITKRSLYFLIENCSNYEQCERITQSIVSKTAIESFSSNFFSNSAPRPDPIECVFQQPGNEVRLNKGVR